MIRTLLTFVSAVSLATLASSQTFTFGLDGAQETPPVPTPGTGTCSVTLDAVTGSVSVAGSYTGLVGTATAAHIHDGFPGSGGPIVLGLSTTGGTTGTISGGGTLTPGEVATMLAGGHYVNLHTTSFGGGELRGQVEQAAIVTAYGGNPAGSLIVTGGTPVVGASMVLGVDNPLGTQPVGSLPFVGIATAADPLFDLSGTGSLVPGWGMGGGAGELLISVLSPNPLLSLGGAAWAGPGSPAPVPLSIPSQVSLIGVEVFAQGVMVNLIGPGPTFGLTNGLALTIGS